MEVIIKAKGVPSFGVGCSKSTYNNKGYNVQVPTYFRAYTVVYTASIAQCVLPNNP